MEVLISGATAPVVEAAAAGGVVVRPASGVDGLLRGVAEAARPSGGSSLQAPACHGELADGSVERRVRGVPRREAPPERSIPRGGPVGAGEGPPEPGRGVGRVHFGGNPANVQAHVGDDGQTQQLSAAA
eukprot:2336152-Lingulodinium_polyedra.AAC.1